MKNGVGLFNTNVRVGDNMFPSNIFMVDNINEIMDKSFLISKPVKSEKGDYNIHKTVKPLEICEHLIQLSTFSDDAIVLDPFVGSGTTAVAAKKLGRKYIGLDINKEYVEIALQRLKDISSPNIKLDLNKKAETLLTLLEKKQRESSKNFGAFELDERLA